MYNCKPKNEQHEYKHDFYYMRRDFQKRGQQHFYQQSWEQQINQIKQKNGVQMG